MPKKENLSPQKPRLIAIMGPTASGKSSLAFQAAPILGGEIVNCDALQLHRSLEIGTAKPSHEQREQIPHHLYDVLEPDQYFSAGNYMIRARKVCREIASRRRVSIVVGGTGLYFKALLEGIFVGPGRSNITRDRLREVARKKGTEYLYGLLKRKDPEAGKRIKGGDLIRIIRALEIYFTTGERITDLQSQRVPLKGFSILRVGLNVPRSILYDRINRRVAEIFDRGLIEETQKLLANGYGSDCKGFEAIGYRQAVAVLRGELTRKIAIELTQRDTRRYAKRQMTWFKREPEVCWISDPGEDRLALEKLVQLVQRGCEASS